MVINIHSVNLLYLIIHSAAGYFKEKNGEKYLIIDSTDKYKKFGLELDQKLEQLMMEKNCFMKKSFARIAISTDNGLPLKKQLKFTTVAIIIRFVFQEV